MTHPDPFTDSALRYAATLLRGRRWVFDPFAGTGRIHELRNTGIHTLGFEIEPEWAHLHEGTICADSTTLRDYLAPNSVPAIFTAPTVGNRTSRHSPTDPNPTTRTNTYRARLGHDLHAHNTSRYQYHHREFQSLHDEIWRQCVEVLEPGGLFLIVTRDFIRRQTFIRTNAYHLTKLDELGLTYHQTYPIYKEIYRKIGNRTGVEFLHVLTKAPDERTSSDLPTTRTSTEVDLDRYKIDPLEVLCGTGAREGERSAGPVSDRSHRTESASDRGVTMRDEK